MRHRQPKAQKICKQLFSLTQPQARLTTATAVKAEHIADLATDPTRQLFQLYKTKLLQPCKHSKNVQHKTNKFAINDYTFLVSSYKFTMLFVFTFIFYSIYTLLSITKNYQKQGTKNSV